MIIMSKKKGLSLEEKRSRMIEIFHEKKDFFLLKELEKIAPKEKGIVSQSVKDVLKSLVDDDLVDSDKIGTSVYFWSYPSKALATRKRKLGDVDEEYSKTAKRFKLVQESLEKAKIGKEDTENRETLLSRLNELQEKKETLSSKIKSMDHSSVNRMKEEIELCKNSINRWTDNVFAVQSWIGRKFPSICIRDLNKQFGIPEDLDNI